MAIHSWILERNVTLQVLLEVGAVQPVPSTQLHLPAPNLSLPVWLHVLPTTTYLKTASYIVSQTALPLFLDLVIQWTASALKLILTSVKRELTIAVRQIQCALTPQAHSSVPVSLHTLEMAISDPRQHLLYTQLSTFPALAAQP